jgi:hypothetical protein
MKILLPGLMGIALMLLPVNLYAQRYLTGELAGDYPQGDYIVSGNIHVLPRTTLRFSPGTTLRFENFTGIIVRGEFICKGTILRPIRFTSSRDVPTSRIMPEAFDWNGINVTAEAITICLEFCSIFYSTTGLDIASNATPVALKEVTFFKNGSSSLTRKREMITIDEDVPISFRWPTAPVTGSGQAGLQPLAASADSTQATATTDEKKRPVRLSINWRKTLLYSTGGTALAGGILAVAAHGMALKWDNKYDNEKISANTTSMANRRDEWENIRTIGLAIASVGTVGFTVTYIF